MMLFYFPVKSDDNYLQHVIYFAHMGTSRLRHVVLTVSVFLLGVVGISPLAASSKMELAWTPGVSASASYYGAIATAPDLRAQETLPMRSQLSIDIDVAPLSFRLSRFTFNGELWMRYVSRSLVWGDFVYRPFFAVGPGISIQWQFTQHFGLQLGGALLYCFNGTVHQAFASIDGVITPMVRFASTKHNRFTVTFPIGVQVRNNIVGVSVGVGLRWNYDMVLIGDKDQEATKKEIRRW